MPDISKLSFLRNGFECLGDKRCDNINDMVRNQNTPDELETAERIVSVGRTMLHYKC